MHFREVPFNCPISEVGEWIIGYAGLKASCKGWRGDLRRVQIAEGCVYPDCPVLHPISA